jgi:hypothetical protein
VLSALAVLLTLGLLLFGLYRLLQARYRIEPGTPLLARCLQQLAPAGTVLEQRQRAMLQQGNLWEAARDLARHCFEPAGSLPARAGKKPGPAGHTMALPRILVTAGWQRRWVLQHQVRRLWQLAYGHSTRRVSPREFARLVGWCRDVRAALADGSLRLDQATD